MASNYFISYDLIAPGQHYDRVIGAIKELGNWARVEYSLYYVRSSWATHEVANHVWAAMTENDKLIVVNASNDDFGGYNIDPVVLKQLQTEWNA